MNRRSLHCSIVLNPLAATLLALGSDATFAQATPTPEAMLPRVDVIGGEVKLPNVAGTSQVLGNKELEASHVFTVDEALRKVPGVHARDEEGGLRPNIGMRGLNPARPTKITLLEGGSPLAYAPYGDNAGYCPPQVDRYERIEVLKGAGSLLFGPQTVGA